MGVIYAPPDDTLNAGNLGIPSNLSSPFIIGGDWNAKYQFWNNFSANKAGNLLYNHMQRLVADPIRDITATIRKRISYLRIMEWDRTLRSFNKPDPTFWTHISQNHMFSHC